MKITKRTIQLCLFIAIPVLILICTLISIHIVNSMDYHHNDNDFFTFWLAGHIVSQGGNPYDSTTWISGYHQFEINIIANQAFLYPLPLALLLAPLGLLPFHSAYIGWVTLLQLTLIGSLVGLLFISGSPRAKHFFIPLLAGLILFRPTYLTLTQGQIVGIYLPVIISMATLFQKSKWGWGGILMGLLVLKPNLGLFIILLTGAWLVFNRKWIALIYAAFTALVLLVGGLLYNPGWMGEYLQVGSSKLAQTFGASPTVWGISALVCRADIPCIQIYGGIAAGLVMGFAFFILFRNKAMSPLQVAGLVVTVTLLATPYTWTYDQLLLLIPIVLLTLALDGKGWRFVLAFCFFLLLDLLILILLFFDTLLGVEILNAFLPLGIFVLLAGLVFFQKVNPSGVKSIP